MFAAGKTAAVSGAGPDDKFNYVTMLLHGDGTNGAQNNTFLDSSTNAFSITRNGNTTQGSFSPYGSNWSNYSPSSAYFYTASSANLNLGAGSFTLEFWVNPSALTNEARMVTVEGSSTIGIIMGGGGAGGSNTDIQVNQFGTATLLNASAVLSVGTWTHVAITYNGTTSTLWVNGVSQNTTSGSVFPNSNSSVTVFGSVNYANSAYKGYISNLRLLKGTCLYTTAFTPSTTPLTAITNTALLTCQSNRFFDASANAFGFTFSGSPSVQRFNPFGTSTAYSTSVIGGSAYFDGTGDTLSCTGSLPATGDFTLSMWVYPTSLSGYTRAIEQSGSGNFFYLFLGYADGMVDIQVGNSAYSDFTAGVYKANQWNYIQIVKSSSAYSFYINGTALSVTGGVGNIGTTSIASGTLTVNYNVGCYITDVRIVNTALGNSVPTAPLTAVSGTTMLLSMQNGAIYDNAMMNDLETVGNAQISTSVKKFGTGSMYFDGTGDYLVGNGGQGLGGDFTIEAWVYALGFSGDARVIVDTRDAWFSSTGLNFYFNDAGNLIMYVNGGDRITSATAYSTNTWYFVTLVRSGSTITMYVNGTSVGTYTYSTALTDKTVIVGTATDNRNTGTAWKFYGYIDDLRITKGYARYTSTFTPPTSALSDTGPY